MNKTPVLTLLTDNNFQEALCLCESGALNSTAYTRLLLAENTLPDNGIWCATVNKTIKLLAVNCFGELYLCGNKEIQPETLKELTLISGANQIIGNKTMLDKANFSEKNDIFIMKYTLTDKSSNDKNSEQLSAYGINEMLTSLGNRSVDESFSLRYVQTLRRINHSLGGVYGVKNQGVFVSFASVASINKDSAVIGDVFTKEQFRGRGFAQKALRSCVNEALMLNKKPYVLCEKSLMPFYEKSGFVKADTIVRAKI